MDLTWSILLYKVTPLDPTLFQIHVVIRLEKDVFLAALFILFKLKIKILIVHFKSMKHLSEMRLSRLYTITNWILQNQCKLVLHRIETVRHDLKHVCITKRRSLHLDPCFLTFITRTDQGLQILPSALMDTGILPILFCWVGRPSAA